MPQKGSNDLNMLLKAQVVQLRAELDVKGSLPRIKEQIGEISEKVKNKPVKLKVELDYKIGELRSQLKTLETAIVDSKTIKPIKLQVQIDVKGSAQLIKNQLKDIYKTVDDFNKKYGEQVKRFEEFTKRQEQSKKGGSPTPTGGKVDDFNFKLYANQVREAEAQMRSVFGKHGLFSSVQMKDAEGNLQGFIAKLEKANGVVQQVQYRWNQDAGKFTPINQQTTDTMQKHIHKARQSLELLHSDILKLNKGTAQTNLFKDWDDLEKRASHGTLTQDSVKKLQARIKEEQVLQGVIEKQNKEYYDQQKLIQDIKRTRAKDWAKNPDGNRNLEYKAIIDSVRNDGSANNLKKESLALQKLNDESEKQARIQAERIKNDRRRLQVLKQLETAQRTMVSTGDNTSRQLANEIKLMSTRAKTTDDWLAISKKMHQLRLSNAQDKDLNKALEVEFKIEQKMRRLVDVGAMTNKQFETNMKKLGHIAQRGLADLEREYSRVGMNLQKVEADLKRQANTTKTLISGNTSSYLEQNQLKGIKDAIKHNDIESLQKYVGQIQKGTVETIKLEQTQDKLGRSVDRLQVKMKGTGKTVKTYTIDLDRASNTLRQINQGLDYNANRNLGIMEQLRIAMERVPVWMTAMTAFYGTIHGFQAMGREILAVDKALTELKRVADDGINIEYIFEGAMNLSQELGNNIHNVMQTLNDFARTFGQFNERQLLAITKTATLMSNVSELTAQEAGETLIGTMNAFGIMADESIRIADAMNEVKISASTYSNVS